MKKRDREIQASEQDEETVVDVSLDDGVERMTGEGGVATEVPHERIDSSLASSLAPSDRSSESNQA